MHQVLNGYRGLSVFLELNADRFLAVFAIVSAVALAGWVQSV